MVVVVVVVVTVMGSNRMFPPPTPDQRRIWVLWKGLGPQEAHGATVARLRIARKCLITPQAPGENQEQGIFCTEHVHRKSD